MAQGKAWNKDEVIEILEEYFRLGCNVTKACDYAGVPRTTVQTWIEEDDGLRLKITAWQNEVNLTARKNVTLAIKRGNVTDSWDWLAKKEKDEFSSRSELTGANGESLIPERADEEQAAAAVGSFLKKKHEGHREDTGEQGPKED